MQNPFIRIPILISLIIAFIVYILGLFSNTPFAMVISRIIMTFVLVLVISLSVSMILFQAYRKQEEEKRKAEEAAAAEEATTSIWGPEPDEQEPADNAQTPSEENGQTAQPGAKPTPEEVIKILQQKKQNGDTGGPTPPF